MTVQNFNTLKDYIADYQEKGEASTALNRLINVSAGNNGLTKVSFKDKSLNFMMFNIEKKYGNIVSINDLQNWFINGLYERVFDKANLEYEPAQIVKWADMEINGYIKRQIDNKVEDIEQVISANYTVEGSEQTHYDDVAIDDYFSVLELDNKFNSYVSSIGGLRKLLTKRQLEIYNLSNIEGATHQSIADELNVTKQAVTKAIATAKNKIKKEFMTWKTMQSLHKNKELYDVIKDYLANYEQIATFDVEDTFDYYGYTVAYFKRNVSDHKEDIADVLIDNATKANRELLIDVLQQNVYVDTSDSNVLFAKRQQDQFVMAVLRAFNNCVKQVSDCVSSFSNNVVDFADDKNGYEQVAELF